MAEWWKTTGWPWVKTNWWAVLLAPVALIVFAMMFLLKSRTGVVMDPLRGADERAVEEERLRTAQLAEEKKRLAKRVEELETETRAQQEHMERRVAEEVAGLRNNPEALRELMIRTGPGKP